MTLYINMENAIVSDVYVSEDPVQQNKSVVIDPSNNLPVHNVYCVIKWGDDEAKCRFRTSEPAEIQLMESLPFDIKTNVNFSTYNGNTTLNVVEYEINDPFGMFEVAKAMQNRKAAQAEQSTNGAKPKQKPAPAKK